MTVAALIIAGALVLFRLKTPRPEGAPDKDIVSAEEVLSNKTHQFERRSSEIPPGTNMGPQKLTTTAPETRNESRQQEAFKEFVEKMNRHSELLHEEFNTLERIRALHPDDGPNTNHLVFEKARQAFEELGRTASTNDDALELLLDARKLRYLEGFAVRGIGVAAQNGNEKAVDLLLEPEKNGWLLSSSTGELVKVAQAGDERAIEFMYRLTTEPKNSALWWFASDALAPAAEEGNERAISGLINMSGFENESIRRRIFAALKAAAEKGNESAKQALKGIQSPE